MLLPEVQYRKQNDLGLDGRGASDYVSCLGEVRDVALPCRRGQDKTESDTPLSRLTGVLISRLMGVLRIGTERQVHPCTGNDVHTLVKSE